MGDFFLLGAGASMEADVPSAVGMTTKMLDVFSKDMMLKRQSKVLRFVVGGLLFKQGTRGENPFDGVNIEDLFNAVLSLADRKNSELTPFVSSWNPAIEELEGGVVSDSTSRQLLEIIYDPIERHLSELIRRTQGNGGLGRMGVFSNRIDSFLSQSRFRNHLTASIREFLTGGGGRLLTETADMMRRKLIEMVWVTDPKKIQHLVPLLIYAKQNKAIITTLNYDNTIELSAQTAGIQIDTGFESWSEKGDFSFNPEYIPLIKLHGSIDWSLSQTRPSAEKLLFYETIQKVVPTDDANRGFRPAIVFGGRNKLTTEGPFLSLLRAFELKIRQCDRLIVVGYSFRDDHVNEYIRSWINGDTSRIIMIINPNIAELEVPFYKELRNIENKARVVPIPKNASVGILEITSEPPEVAKP
jgi:NAD-dependent SIR2 family protein deacetylase